jgi:hypothetical protein
MPSDCIIVQRRWLARKHVLMSDAQEINNWRRETTKP